MIQQADTIAYDLAKIADYQSDSSFDYNRQFETTEFNPFRAFFEWLSEQIGRILRTGQGDAITTWFLIIFFILAVMFVVYFIWRTHPGLFLREKKRETLAYEVEEESIYGIDFEKELRVALAADDFRTAIRLLYLQTLRFMADRQWIDWQIYKTPTEYTREMKPAGMKPAFRLLTNHFLQVRYGNFRATREVYDAMRGLQDKLKKGGRDEAIGQ
ncbi:MAG: DUF4129 domain-containing protein [Tannerella sp.]|jgi:hypothetical protein|nr:DUF4129 domain-containing protein [Tannerella sp.]